MVQSTFSIRLDEEVKNDMNSMCESIGMSMSTAFNIFARAFVRNRGFPFEVKLDDSGDPWDGFLEARRALKERYPEEPEMEEIDAEVKTVRSSASH